MPLSQEAIPSNSLSVKINGLDDWYNFIKYRILEKAQTHLNILQLNFCISYKLLDIALGICKKDFNDLFLFYIKHLLMLL